MIQLPATIRVVEVGPRDGLQSFPRHVDTDTKVRLIDRLSRAGLPTIEVTGFAHPKVIPNLSDAADVCERIERRAGTVYRGLVPNAYGARRAAASRLDELLGLIIMSATYLRKNQNRSLEQAADEAVESFRIAEQAGMDFVMALGGSFWCPYEGRIAETHVLQMLRRLRNAGIRRFYLAGSVGMEDPRHVNELFARAYDAHPDIELGFHVHNLSGMAPANILAALDAGAQWIEGAVCGIGGGIAMPAEVGAVGNFPTEDLVSMLELMGVRTGVEPGEMLAAAHDVAALLEISPRSRTGNGLTRENVRKAPDRVD